MTRSYYSANYKKFFGDTPEHILGELSQNDTFTVLLDTQVNAWKRQIEILREELQKIQFDRIMFEYTIPRMGRRVDNILLYKGIVFLLEFKVGSKSYDNSSLKQVEGYGIDLKNFQEGSRDRKLVPILISTEAPDSQNKIEMYDDGVCKPLKANSKNLHDIILEVIKNFDEPELDSITWENSVYNPTPTIIEASQALYNNHTVKEITRTDLIGKTFTQTSDTVDKIISDSKKFSKKSIIFITGVPGSGKTLVGLNVASKYQDSVNNERAVYISGTATLIAILQEALVRDKVSKDSKLTKTRVQREVQTLFQYLLHYRREIIKFPNQKPSERIVVFDEAQRMWNQEQLDKEIGKKLGKEATGKSEPDLLIEHMNKHDGWAVIICLIGGGQEIHKGEYGTVEWLKSIKNNFPQWDVFIPSEITKKEYLGDVVPNQVLDDIKHSFVEELHLKVSTRSFKAENLSKLINQILDRDVEPAKQIVNELKGRYPLLLTRNLQTAKDWVKSIARGEERYGLFTIALSHRLHPEGIVKRGPKEFNPQGWWLDSPEYVDSSFALEIPCTEFFSQGLELDWAIFGWDACFRPNNSDWEYLRFSRKEWKRLQKTEEKRNLKNAFRVLLTRARQGMIIFVPFGDDQDVTRLSKFYDGIYNYLKELGIEEI